MALTTRGTLIALASVAYLSVALPSRVPAGVFCVADCDGDGVVTVDEIVRLVGAVLVGTIAECPAGDVDRDQRITIDEVVAAVTKALFGCATLRPGPDLTRQLPRPKLVVGGLPGALAVADVDGDRHADIATVSIRDGALSILLQRDDGGFLPHRRIAVGGSPIDVRAAALGPKRTPAFVVANSESDALTVTSYAHGAFRTMSFAVGSSPIGLAVADLNGDSLTDVVVANAESEDVSVLLGADGGGFTTATPSEVNGRPSALVAGDLDRDGAPDVLVVLESTELKLLRGLGDGALASPVTIDIGVGASSVEIADLNGDQVNDLVVLAARREPAVAFGVVALVAHADGSFAQTDELSIGEAPLAMTVADADGDGVRDVVTGNAGTASVFFGRGDGSFLDELALPTEAAVSAVEVADVDGDGLPDIVYAALVDDEVSIFWGLGGREFAAARSFLIGGTLPDRLLSPDVDGDGLPDLATLNRGSDDVSILHNLGNGAFANPVVVAAPSQLQAMTFGHFDHDRFPDLATGYESRTCTGCMAVFRGMGDSGFDSPVTFATMPRIVSLAVGHLDADMIDDIVSLGPAGVSVLTGLGASMFAPAQTYVIGSDPRAMVVADFNGDGFDDVATVNASSISVLLATGTGSFLPAVNMETTTPLASIDAADLNADGAIDLVVVGGGRVVVFFGGEGGFPASLPLTFALASGPGFDLADVNRDGRVDLVSIANGLVIYPGIDTAVFTTPQRFVSHPLAVQALVADLNADGVADVATVNAALDGSVSVILGAAP